MNVVLEIVLMFKPRAFKNEYGFYLYPTRKVLKESNRLRNTRSPRSPSNLVSELQIISGTISEVNVTGEPLEKGSTLTVEFFDKLEGKVKFDSQKKIESKIQSQFGKQGLEKFIGHTEPHLYQRTDSR